MESARVKTTTTWRHANIPGKTWSDRRRAPAAHRSLLQRRARRRPHRNRAPLQKNTVKMIRRPAQRQPRVRDTQRGLSATPRSNIHGKEKLPAAAAGATGHSCLADINCRAEKSPSTEDGPSDGRIRQACESSARASSMCAGGKKVADRLRERRFVAFVKFARAQQPLRHIICGASLHVSRILSAAEFPASTAISRPTALRDSQSSYDRCPSGAL